MLYDKRWDKTEIKADPLSLESLIAWLETMPADGEYCYLDNGCCLLGQYFTAMGFESVAVGGHDFDHETGTIIFSELFGNIAYGDPFSSIGSRTFGDALARARAANSAQQ